MRYLVSAVKTSDNNSIPLSYSVAANRSQFSAVTALKWDAHASTSLRAEQQQYQHTGQQVVTLPKPARHDRHLRVRELTTRAASKPYCGVVDRTLQYSGLYVILLSYPSVAQVRMAVRGDGARQVITDQTDIACTKREAPWGVRRVA